MFDIFKIFSKIIPNKTIKGYEDYLTIEYNSYDCFNLILTKIIPYICKYSDSKIDFNIQNYDLNINYDSMFDYPIIDANTFLTKDITINELDKIAHRIINNWKYDDSASILAEDICNSCKENNSNNVSLSFIFTNYCPNFKQPGLIVYWKTN